MFNLLLLLPLAVCSATCPNHPPALGYALGYAQGYAQGPAQDSVQVDYMHRYGMSISREKWLEEGQNGQVITTAKNGVRISQTYYYGVLDGESTWSFPFSSVIEKQKQYSRGQLLKDTVYYPSGITKQELTLDPAEHTSTLKQWYENGQLRSEEKMSGQLLVHATYYDPQGKALSNVSDGQGQRTFKDPFGTLVFTEQFHSGQVELRTSFYPDGSPKEIDPYVNGLVEGQRKTYFPGGEPKTIETWNKGKQEGLTIVFRDGEKYQEIPYIKGYKNGIGHIFKDGAIVVQDLTWKNDQLHGKCTTYIENRPLVEWYFKGRRVTKGYYDSFNFKPTIED